MAFPLGQSLCHGAAGRGRSALLWGQLALGLALTFWAPLRDPEYGRRLESLRTRLAERPSSQSPVLFLGSSRVARGFRPGLLSANHAPEAPVVFNFGLCRAGPLMELLCLRRLLADGVRPQCVFIEVYPQFAASGAEAQITPIQPARLRWSDLRVWRPYFSDPDSEYRQWWHDQAVPCLSHRSHLLNQCAPDWVVPDKRYNTDWDGLDGWGWLSLPDRAADARRVAEHTDALAKIFVPIGNNFTGSEDSRRAYTELLAVCRAEDIKAALVVLPDGLLSRYEPAGRARMDAFLRERSTEAGVPLIDARDWIPIGDLNDGVHLSSRGAAAFTEKFDREVLQPYLDGEPLDRRWPPGRLNSDQASR